MPFPEPNNQQASLEIMDRDSPVVPAVTIPTSPPRFRSSHLSLGAYEAYTINSQYSKVTGYAVLPTSEDTGVTVRIHKPMTTKVVTWCVERKNAKPVLPKLDTGDPNEVPISQTINFVNCEPMPNGGTYWRVGGSNVYQLLKPKSEDSKYPIGVTPAELDSSSTRYFGPEDFSSDLLDSSFATE